MLKRTIPILLALAVLLTACGPQAEPTMSPADVQGTAVAAAWTMVAATQAAIPSATPMPPTATPSPTSLPTFTPMPLQTSGTTTSTTLLIPPTATQGSNTNQCLMPLDMGEAGPTVRFRIENETGATIRLSLTMWQINAFGQCGAVGPYNLGRNGSETVALPKGSWFAYAWVSYPNGSSGTSSGSFVIPPGAPDELQRLIVRQEVVLLKP